MFGTWKYDPETQKVQNIRKAYDPESARSSGHQACNRCHEKKLKCSGEKGGCDRCTAHRLACDYSRSGTRHSKKGKKSGQHSSCSSRSGRDESNSPTHFERSVSFPARDSTDRRTSHRAKSHGTRGSAQSAGGDVYHHMMPEMHSSMTATQTEYDLNLLQTSSASHTLGYHSTTMEGYGHQETELQPDPNWMMHASTASYGTDESYLSTFPGDMYSSNVASYTNADYSTAGDYDAYHGYDQRYWGQTH